MSNNKLRPVCWDGIMTSVKRRESAVLAFDLRSGVVGHSVGHSDGSGGTVRAFDLSKSAISLVEDTRTFVPGLGGRMASRLSDVPAAAKNCGTGHGGFKPGNTCGAGGAAALAAVSSALGLEGEALRTALSGAGQPLGSPKVAGLRAAATDAILAADAGVKDAVLRVLPAPGSNSSVITKLSTGNVAAALKEYASTPTYDLQSLSKITVKSTPQTGRAVCNMGNRSLTMGTTSASGDYRHELGHALRSALGGEKGHSGRTATTKAVSAEFDKVQAKVKADPSGLNTKLSHDAYEKKYGVVGRRSLDNWEENFAEHYRMYHREVFRDLNEGGGGKFLAQYRSRHPGWAKIWDAHYTAAMLAEGK